MPNDIEDAYLTGFTCWKAAQDKFRDWTLNGARLDGSGRLQLDLPSASRENDPYPAGGYHERNFYNGESYSVGEAASPEISITFAVNEAIASWNASTPDGTWLETLVRVKYGKRWSKWFNLGVWASSGETVERHSVDEQRDTDGNVAVDVLEIVNKEIPAAALQIKVRLFSVDGEAVPAVEGVSLAYSGARPRRPKASAGDPAKWRKALPVPQCSQMVYPNGGNVWCSPTTVAMVLGYWTGDGAACEARVRQAVAGTYDWLFDGNGNWPFNTAYAASQGLQGYVRRYTSLAELEGWVKAEAPVIMIVAWGEGELSGAPMASSNGHLVVLVGFDEAGNPVINDPAAKTDAEVQRTYLREELEPLWLSTSGGTVYLIYPAGFSFE